MAIVSAGERKSKVWFRDSASTEFFPVLGMWHSMHRLPVLVAAGWGWRLWKDHGLRRPWLRIGLLPLGMLAAAVALAAARTPDFWPIGSGLGGYAGSWMLGALLDGTGQSSVGIRFIGVGAAVMAARCRNAAST